jgi:hypothetical protein
MRPFLEEFLEKASDREARYESDAAISLISASTSATTNPGSYPDKRIQDTPYPRCSQMSFWPAQDGQTPHRVKDV